MTALLIKIINPYLFWPVCELRLESYDHETVYEDTSLPRSSISAHTFGCGMYSQATPRLMNLYITGCDEFASNQLWASRRVRLYM